MSLSEYTKRFGDLSFFGTRGALLSRRGSGVARCFALLGAGTSIISCAASSTTRSMSSDTSGTSAGSTTTTSVSAKATGAGTSEAQAASAPSASLPKAKASPDPNQYRCNVSIIRGKVGGSNRPGVARIELYKSQDTSGGQLIRRTKDNTIEWVETLEFTKEGSHPAATYELEFRRDDGTWCPLRIPLTDDDIEKEVILSLAVRFL